MMYSNDQLTSSLEEIIRNCQRNEKRLYELELYTRNERRKAERLLQETYRTKQEHEQQISNLKSKRSSIEYFVSFDDNHLFEKPDSKPYRVRFNIPEKEHNISSLKKSKSKDDELAELAQRCDDLLSSLQMYHPRTKIFNYSDDYLGRISPIPDDDQSVTLQESLELLRPDFISHSRQRIEHINHLREEREYQHIFPSYRNIREDYTETPLTYQEMKKASKKKYEQLPEVNQRLQENLRNEIKRRNYLRAKIFRVRLRQHVLLHGRTNIDESLTMIDT